MNQLILFLTFLFSFQMAYSVDSVACNEKLIDHIKMAAKKRCDQKSQTSLRSLVLSRRGLDVSKDWQELTGGFFFTCKSGHEYLGLIKFNTRKNCSILKTEIAHTSRFEFL